MSKVTARRPAVERIAGWSARHRKTAVFGWLFLIVAAVVVGGALKGTSVKSYSPGETGRAGRAMDAAGIVQLTESVLIQAPASSPGFATDAKFRSGVADVAAALRALPDSAGNVRSPLDTDHPAGAADVKGLISKDGRSALVTFLLPGTSADSAKTVVKPLDAVAAVQRAHPDLTIGEAGSGSVDKAINDVIGKGFQTAEIGSLPVTLILLLIVFGALVAASVPLLLAITAVAAAVSLLGVAGHWIPVDASTSSVVLLIGMAVGVDYSLFYIRREREERLAGRSPEQALRIAAATSGRAILVSGLTVMVSLAGLFLTDMDIFSGWAVGTMLVVGMAMLGSVTFIPALLAWLGDRVDKGKIPILGKRRAKAQESKFWRFLVRRVVRHPLVFGLPVLGLLVAAALPATGLQARDGGAVSLTYGKPIAATLTAMQTAFPGGPAPAELIIHGDTVNGPQVQNALAQVKTMMPNAAGMASKPSADGHYLLVDIPLAGDGADKASVTALNDLRDRVLPATLGHVPGIDYAVGGYAASSHDFAAQLHKTTPLVIGFVVLLAFLLMIAAFRSLAIPVTAVLVNLLSVAAAYGVMKWVFQDGHFEKQLGFQSYGGVVSWLPLFMFVVLFGLSMDYHVFIISRIKELRHKGHTTQDAVVDGIASSSGVVTSAAAIMIAVFSLFALMPFGPMKMTGIGMAVAVLIDATLVRGVLVPAAMSLLGERNWTLPRVLRWIPGIDLEGSDAAGGAGAAPVRGGVVPPAGPWVPPGRYAPEQYVPGQHVAGERTSGQQVAEQYVPAGYQAGKSVWTPEATDSTRPSSPSSPSRQPSREHGEFDDPAIRGW